MFAFYRAGEFPVIRYFPYLLARSSTVQLISRYTLMFNMEMESILLWPFLTWSQNFARSVIDCQLWHCLCGSEITAFLNQYPLLPQNYSVYCFRVVSNQITNWKRGYKLQKAKYRGLHLGSDRFFNTCSLASSVKICLQGKWFIDRMQSITLETTFKLQAVALLNTLSGQTQIQIVLAICCVFLMLVKLSNFPLRGNSYFH